jgi:hypothetical protein
MTTKFAAFVLVVLAGLVGSGCHAPEPKAMPGIKVRRTPPVSKRSMAPTVALEVPAVGGIASGIVFRVLSASIRSQAVALGSTITASHGTCVPNVGGYDRRCPTLQNELKTENTYYNVATGSFVAGGAAAAGMVLYLAWPSAKTPEQAAAPSIRLTPIVSPTSHALILSGSF